MKYLKLKVLATAFILSVTGQQVAAACTRATIQGDFEGEYHFPQTEDFWTSQGVLMLNFNGTGRVSIRRLTEGSNGTVSTGSGSGVYSVTPNCTGVARFSMRQGGILVAAGRMDFAIGGTETNPEVLGAYTNINDQMSGNVRLIKSNF
ncbi:MAG: hypothetical protein ACJA09_003577 [Alcanivorax sp.]